MDLQSERVSTLLGEPAVSFRRRRHHHQSGVGRVSRAQVRRDPAAGGDRDAGDLCARAAAGVRAGFRSQPAHHPPLREVQEARGVSRRPPRCTARAATRNSIRIPPNWCLGPIHKQRWIYSCVKQLLDRIIYAYGQQGLQFTLVPALQLDRLGPRQHGRPEGGQLARADAVSRAHRARRTDQAGRWRHPDPRLYLHRRCRRVPDHDHRQSGRHRRRQDLQHRQSAQLCTRSASWRR